MWRGTGEHNGPGTQEVNYNFDVLLSQACYDIKASIEHNTNFCTWDYNPEWSAL